MSNTTNNTDKDILKTDDIDEAVQILVFGYIRDFEKTWSATSSNTISIDIDNMILMYCGKREIHTWKILVLGEGGVGRSSLIARFVQDTFSSDVIYDPTLIENYLIHTTVNGKECSLDILDYGGCVEFSDEQDQLIRENDAFLIVYSITSMMTLDMAEMWREKVLRCK
eukprot:425560_1